MDLNSIPPRVLKATELRIKKISNDKFHVACGFELASYAVPSKFDSTNQNANSISEQSFPGESSLAKEIHGALLPFLESIPDGAALIVEYHFLPVSEGVVSFKTYILVETSATNESEATAETTRLFKELEQALSVLSDWYSFKPASFSAVVPLTANTHVVQILPGSREVHSNSQIGFSLNKKLHKRVLVPAILPTDIARRGRPTLLFRSGWSVTVGRILLSARALSQPAVVKISLIRESIPAALYDLFDIAKKGKVGKVYDGVEHEAPDQSGLKETINMDLDLAGDNFLDDLAAQSIATRLKVEVTSNQSIPEVFLRVLGLDMFPGAPIRLKYEGAEKTTKNLELNVFDLSDMLPYPHWLPPLLPSPYSLERTHFPRHYSNTDILLPNEGLELGRMQSGGFERPVFMAQADRSRHMYLLGATGTGKSTLIYNMARQDMEAGHGVAVVDPHGDLFEQLLSAVPKARLKDVVIIDPSDRDFPVGLNPLDFPKNVSAFIVNRVINNLLDIFGKLYNMDVAGGPAFEQYFRNSFKLAVSAPHEIYTDQPLSLYSITRILRDGALREKVLLSLPPDDQVRTFFEQALKTRGDSHFENMVPYITNKLTRFVDNPLLKSMLCSPKRTINFREVIDKKKILLVNLAKGDIGAFDARLIGMLVTNYIFEAALERADTPPSERTPFYYYLDEFQNFTTDTIADILAEARKYGLHMILANQTLSQLINPDLIHKNALLDAVLGNVATKLCMRVGLEDAKLLEPHFLPQFNKETSSQLPDRYVISRMLVNGYPSKPFVFSTLPPKPLPQENSTNDIRTQAIEFSRKKYSIMKLFKL